MKLFIIKEGNVLFENGEIIEVSNFVTENGNLDDLRKYVENNYVFKDNK